MAQVIFISEQYIKDTSYIDENVDVKLLRNCILETQDIRIRSIIGTGLYDELKTQISAGTRTALNITLLTDYIAPALKYWVLHDAALILTFKIMNKAIVKRNSENAEVVQATELDRLMDFFKGRAEYYSERITKYLIENEASFPFFTDAGDGVDIEHPKFNNFTQGVYLGTSTQFKDIDIDYGRNNY